MKKWFPAAGVIALVAVLAFWASHREPRAPIAPLPIAPTPPPAVAISSSAVSPAPMEINPIVQTAIEEEQAAAAAVPERAVVQKLRARIHDFDLRFGGNPVGTNAEITKALIGSNAKGVQFLDERERQLNDQGELLDPWGTPYFFHQLSAHQMEIRSAGPDQIMWNGDDQVIK